MVEIIKIMQDAMQSSKEAGSYALFFILALGLGLAIAWDRYGFPTMEDNWMVEEAKNKIQLWPFLYGLLAVVLVACNPLAIFLLNKITPIAGQYHKIWSLPLILFLCAYAMVCFLSILRERKQRLILVLGFIVLIGLAGSSYGLMSNRETIKTYQEEEKILNLVKERGEDSLLLATDRVLEYAGVYEPNLKVLYGKDLYTPNMDLGIMDGYEPELMDLYEAMKNPEGCMGEIANMASLYDCDMIVLPQFEAAPDKAGQYYKNEGTESYMLYVR